MTCVPGLLLSLLSLTAAPLAAGGEQPAASLNLPGEKEFSSCLRLDPHRRFKLTLKPETDVQGLVGWISAATCRQFIIPGGLPLTGRKVTVISPQDMAVREAYPLFMALLDSVQLTVEPVGKFLRIIESAKAVRAGAPFRADGELSPSREGYATQFIRLQNADPGELGRILDAFRGESGNVTAYPALSALIVTDREANLARIAAIVAALDAPGETAKLWVLPVRHLQAKDLADRLTELLGKAVAPAQPRGPGPVPTPASGGIRLYPDERSGRLLVVATDAAFARVAAVAQRLDVAVTSGAARVHVYRCKHADCDALAALLGTLAGIDVARGPAPSSGGKNNKAAAPVPAVPTGMARAGAETSLVFDGPVRVTSDPSTNSLLAVSSLDDFRTLQRLAEDIDVPRKQVFIEATIMEVLLGKDRSVGVGYHLGDSVGGGLVAGGWQPATTLLLDSQNLGSSLVGLSGIALGAPVKGLAEALGLSGKSIPSVGAFIHLLQSNQNINLVANPHILITNNQEGEISVGQKIPFQSGITSVPGASGTGVAFVPVSREDVALTLTVTPHVNEDNLIRLEINQEMSEVAAGTDTTFGPTTTQRKARTTVFAHDRQPIIIGGLMRDKIVDSAQKVPLLGDIPLLGALFRSTRKTVEKQNILIALTPHVIEGPGDLAQVLEGKLRDRREFIRYFGSDEERLLLARSPGAPSSPGMLQRINEAVKEVEEREVADGAEGEPAVTPEPLPL
jgi:general secretion pathway protein D